MTSANAAHSFLDHHGPIPIAHRGGAIDQPENTMPAFQNAADLGYRYLETDVHVTSDGVLVAFHDATLDRVTEYSGRINEMTWFEVSKARVRGVDGTQAPIPRFEELMTTFPTMSVTVDPKEDSSVEPLADALAELDCLDRVCVGSFSDKRLRRFRERFGTDVCLGLGTASTVKLRLASWHFAFGPSPGEVAQVPPSTRGIRIVDKRFLATAKKRSLAVHVWTIDDAAEMNRLLDLGVDAIMTDRPETLRSVFIERGLWY